MVDESVGVVDDPVGVGAPTVMAGEPGVVDDPAGVDDPMGVLDDAVGIATGRSGPGVAPVWVSVATGCTGSSTDEDAAVEPSTGPAGTPAGAAPTSRSCSARRPPRRAGGSHRARSGRCPAARPA